jgi:hypothetical protein
MEPKNDLFWREDPSPITGGRIIYMVFTSRSSYGTVGNLDDYVWPEQSDHAWNDMKLTILTD